MSGKKRMRGSSKKETHGYKKKKRRENPGFRPLLKKLDSIKEKRERNLAVLTGQLLRFAI
nr:hypothetical protein [uncultured Flavonifractor sp.]